MSGAVSDTKNEIATRRVTIFYDGDCGMCSRFVRVLLRAGVPDDFYFASQQGDAWARLTVQHPRILALDTVVVLVEDNGPATLRIHSDAVGWTLGQLRFPYSLGRALLVVPRPLRDTAYRFIARHRKRLSALLPGNAACPVPPEHLRNRFLP
jgi:predicted DCC family thiol-disulfide oxidoreductase YuxK